MISSRPVELPQALLAQASHSPAIRAAIVNAASPVVLDSAREAAQLGLMEPVLVGVASTIRQQAAALDWDISAYRVVDAASQEQASDAAVELVRMGEAAALVKGDVHTEVLLRAVIQRRTGLLQGRPLSHVFHMTVPGCARPLFITDAVLNVNPNVTKKRRILRNAVDLLHALDLPCPKVALLSATEKPTKAMPSSQEAEELARLVQEERWPDVAVQGPLAFDLAVSKHAAQVKGVEGPVAGAADLLVVPNIETGNALFKMLVYFNCAAAAGIVMGAKAPIMLTSRADSSASRIASAALTAVYASSQVSS